MNRSIAILASLVLNIVVLGSLSWGAYSTRSTPAGEVSITQLPTAEELSAYAHASPEGAAESRKL